MIIADTSGLLAAFVAKEPAHRAVVADLEARSDDPIVVSPYVLAELDYLVATRLGVESELAVLDEMTAGGYELAQLTAADVAVCRELVAKYRDLNIGLADASLVVLAGRYGTCDVLTLDRRHFTALRTLNGRPFTIRPARGQ